MRNDCLRSEVWGANCKFTVFFTAGDIYNNFITDRPFSQFYYNWLLDNYWLFKKASLALLSY